MAMIVVRAPLRVSFIGGGTDLPGFYRLYPGRVVSSTIDIFIYVVMKPTFLVNKFIVKYQKTEVALHPEGIEHPAVREALRYFNIQTGIEIATFADVPAKTGLGSSSSFAAALLKGLGAFVGKALDAQETAQLASHLEIDLLNEPIGKQDQYAAAFGGFNLFQFNQDESVDRTPISLSQDVRDNLASHSLLFYTGMTRAAGSVLTEQRVRINEHLELYKEMSDSATLFRDVLCAGNLRRMAELLNEGWERKKRLGSRISNQTLNMFFERGLGAGAWGGKVLGAGGGGCLYFLVPLQKRAELLRALTEFSRTCSLNDAKEIPFNFTESGAEILFNHTQK